MELQARTTDYALKSTGKHLLSIIFRKQIHSGSVTPPLPRESLTPGDLGHHRSLPPWHQGSAMLLLHSTFSKELLSAPCHLGKTLENSYFPKELTVIRVKTSLFQDCMPINESSFPKETSLVKSIVEL